MKGVFRDRRTNRREENEPGPKAFFMLISSQWVTPSSDIFVESRHL